MKTLLLCQKKIRTNTIIPKNEILSERSIGGSRLVVPLQGPTIQFYRASLRPSEFLDYDTHLS